MNWVSGLDLISLFLTLVTLLMFWHRWANPTPRPEIKVALVIFFIITLCHHLSNFLEWSGIISILNPYEDYVELLQPIMWAWILYMFLNDWANECLRQERDKARAYLDIVGVVILMLDRDQCVRLVNKKGCELFGLTEKEILGKNWFDVFILPEDRERIRPVFKEFVDEVRQAKIQGDNFVICKGGELRMMAWTATLVHDDQGQVTGVLCAGEDITERRQIEEALLTTKAHERALVDNIPHLAWVKDTSGRYILVNRAFAKSCGFDIKTIIGKTDLDVWPRNLAEKYRADDAVVMRTKEKIFTEETIKETSGIKWFETFKSPVLDQKGNVIGTTGIARDITGRKNAEEELFNSREMLQLVLDTIPQRVFWKDRKSVYLGCNKPFAADCGYADPKDLLGKDDYATASAVKADIYRADDQQVMDTDIPKLDYEEPQVKPDGSQAWLKTSKVPLHDKAGKVIGVLGAYEDITKRKEDEDALRESEEKYHALIDAAGDAIFLADSETGYLIDANRQAEELMGLPVKKIIGMHQTELHPKGEAKYYKEMFFTHATREDNRKQVGFVYNRDKGLIPVHITTGVFELRGRKVVAGIFRDITELKLIEEALKRDKDGLEKIVDEKTEVLRKTIKELEDAKRLSDIGALAATVAHELRNPLGVIKTAVYNIKQKVRGNLLDRHLANIDKKISESERIIKNLLSYAQIKAPTYDQVNALDILNECVDHCRNKYSETAAKVTIRKRGGKLAPIIAVDTLHLNELFANILDNAYQSLSDKEGHINIDFEYKEKENFCQVVIQDNGQGIDKELLPNVFDPFFTTKARGTGLGLSVCNQIVNLYDGRIDIQSIKGQGTTVTIALPIRKR